MMRHCALRRALLAGIAGLTVVLVTAGCGSNTDHTGMPGMGTTSGGSGKLPAGVNQTDVMFAQMMIPHHQQAVAMANLAASRASNADLKALAGGIKAAQDPEITTMTGWLTGWGQAITAPSGSSMPGHDMSGSMPGMMSEQDMTKLSSATGIDFDRMFARMMIAHHNGAIQMAQDEQSNGINADAKTLAGKIVKDQQAEVDTLQKILDRL
jgi:uncharacterized protein (DUF305 family)